MSPIKEAIEALEDFESSMVGNPSCQKGAIQRCRCRVCARERGRAALAALRSMPEPVAWYDVEDGQIISAPRWYSDGGRTEAPLYATPPPAPVLSDAEIDAITVAQWGDRVVTAAYRAYARAILGRASRGAK